MKERLLALAKAYPEVSKKYATLVCVAGLTDKGEWRRSYPIPWEAFARGKITRFGKKHWIEYELESETQSDHRPESRKIVPETIREGSEAAYKELVALLEPKLKTMEELKAAGHTSQSLGVVKPHSIIDFVQEDNPNYEKVLSKKRQKTLLGGKAIVIDPPKYKYSYVFEDTPDCKHKLLCEDWEVGELYRHCEDYRKLGKYRDEKEVFEKVKEKMLDVARKDGAYFIVGTHYRFNTFMIVGVLYPKKSDLKAASAMG